MTVAERSQRGGVRPLITRLRNDLKLRKLCEAAGYTLEQQDTWNYLVRRPGFRIPSKKKRKNREKTRSRTLYFNALTREIRDPKQGRSYTLRRWADLEDVMNNGEYPDFQLHETYTESRKG